MDPSNTRVNSLTNGSESADGLALPNREAARALARRIPNKEREKLYEERGRLVWKQVTHGLNDDETGRLGVVKWSLEQIEDAEVGPDIDNLERVAEMIEAQARNLKRFAADAKTGAEQRHAPYFPRQTIRTKR